MNAHGKKIYRLVLTGGIAFYLACRTVELTIFFSGPCGGKTTAQAVLTTVFETLGWKVIFSAFSFLPPPYLPLLFLRGCT